MLHLNFEENNNEYDENEVEHDNTLDKVKSLLSANLSKQELYIIKFKGSIKEKISIKESPSELDELFSTFAELVKYFGITFCELIKRDEELLNLLFNLLLQENMANKVQEIFYNILQIYNYSSKGINFGDIIKDRLSQCYCNFPLQEKRPSQNVIENLVDEINAFASLVNEPSIIQEKDDLKTSFEELEFDVNLLFDTDKYPRYISEFFSKEIKKIKDVLTLSQNIIFNNDKHEQEKSQKEIINEQRIAIQNPINEKTDSINDLNVQELALNADSIEKELKEKLENRTFFFYGEILSQGEDQFTEFKDYPDIDYRLRQNLIRQYLGFLNSKGGFIYLGITDLKEVKGMNLNYKECDNQRSNLFNLTNNFYPRSRLDKIEISFIPVIDQKTLKKIQDLYVVKIHISAGDPSSLYVAGNSKHEMYSAIRRQTQVLNLTLEEMQTEIIKRSQLNKLCFEIIDTSIIYDNPLINKFKRENKIVRKCGYKLKIANIDKTLKIKDIKRIFKAYGCKVRKFKEKNGKTNGEGYVTFDSEEKARKAMDSLEDSNLGGNGKLKMELEKYYFYYNDNKN